jgi:hypothetical protein
MELHYRHTDTLLLKVQGTYERDCFFFCAVGFRSDVVSPSYSRYDLYNNYFC